MITAIKADIWTLVESHVIVVPVNIGWKRGTGENVMGRGLALQAARKHPYFPLWYGLECAKHGAQTPVLLYPYGPLIAFPTKPLDQARPWMSWKNKSDLALIERGAQQLAVLKTAKPVAVSVVGCGNGGLEMGDVRPILDKHLSDPRFTLVLF
jgi:hypothetical protein